MKPIIFGILNITEDSFSDGGRYLSGAAALEHGRTMLDADVLDLGAAASNPNAKSIPPELEIARLEPVVVALKAERRSISIDTFSTAVQRWALTQQVDYLNDIQGFSDPAIDVELAASTAKLVVMHSVQGIGRASRIDIAAETIFERVCAFFEDRLARLTSAGVSPSRLILDPGMGFFLGSRPEASFEILRRVEDLKAAFGLPVLVSVSRKSFLSGITGRRAIDAGAASLGAEIYAVENGADYIRTHNPAALRDVLMVMEVLRAPESRRIP